ncbi:hypothetical protein A3F55_01395 [Candidatus Adlerbacteria bacterium RIFCSPHIGHO2_12_FULL_53_18]|uniref:Uncharacterized protein n=1 Tax=Candidatus Adlerbacteria bacterium RIFCSPHIGHO2_12_FULL_53_18 TaxID=1797242 RepID=A0A1F4XU41_9BACT|nr:MAG: hypothetical protein A3F55_01395 [Candidatus Adlerbacteria bacterium RIFCSPHIGHO2_12_FULL_53_18]
MDKSKVPAVLAGALALIKDKKHWVPDRSGVYNDKGDWRSIPNEETVRYSTLSVLSESFMDVHATVGYSRVEAICAGSDPIIALGLTLLEVLESVQLKDQWKNRSVTPAWHQECLLCEDMLVNFGKLAGHEGIVNLFQKTLRRLRNEQFKTFSIPRYPEHKHRVGDGDCDVGWCGQSSGYFAHQYPKRCMCGGLIHCDADMSGFNDTYWGPDEQCDGCKEPHRVSSVFDLGDKSYTYRQRLLKAYAEEFPAEQNVTLEQMLIRHTDFCRQYLINILKLPSDTSWDKIRERMWSEKQVKKVV